MDTRKASYALYHTMRPGFEHQREARKISFVPQGLFRPGGLVIFGGGSSNILSIKIGVEEQLAVPAAPAFMFSPNGFILKDMEKWCVEGTLEHELSLRHMVRIALTTMEPRKGVVLELSEPVECVCFWGIEICP